MKKALAALLLFLTIVPPVATAAEQNSLSFDLGLELSHITYKEPQLMRESGLMYGIHGICSYYGQARVPAGVRLDGRLSTGTVTYTGQYSNGAPVEVSGIRDTMFELRGMLGIYNLGEPGAVLMPWVGLGYRYLHDGADRIPGGYERESNYYYVPILLERVPARRPGWSVGWTAEYDYFLSGTQYSYLSDFNPGLSDMTNRQSNGFGWRASVRFLWRDALRTVAVEPFVRYWRIGQSEQSLVTLNGSPYAVGWEPVNNSTELGVQVAVTF